MTTSEFIVSIGVNPGYHHANEAEKPLALGVKAWAEAADAEFRASGIYPSAHIRECKSVYRVEWGCPPGGEDVVLIAGTRIPEYAPDDAAWRDAVRRVAAAMSKTLKQKVVYLRFYTSDFEAIKND